MQYYKFVSWDAIPIEQAIKSTVPAAIMEFEKGNKEPLKNLHISTANPVCHIGGWAFPYRDAMREYWVKTKHYGIITRYALCKGDIRAELKSEVIKIIEVRE